MPLFQSQTNERKKITVEPGMENTQLEPDIKVANSPETIVKGEDTQLKTAVEELLKELPAGKGKKH